MKKQKTQKNCFLCPQPASQGKEEVPLVANVAGHSWMRACCVPGLAETEMQVLQTKGLRGTLPFGD